LGYVKLNGDKHKSALKNEKIEIDKEQEVYEG